MALITAPSPVRPPERATPVGRSPAATGRLARLGLLRDLQRPREVFANLGPNWFASVMGTGIVAVAAASLPEQFPGLRSGAIVIWALAGALFVLLGAATAIHWHLYPTAARHHAEDPVMAHFYGAAPMAALTVGAATLLVGRDVIGLRAAVDVDWVLWFTGTAGGLFTAAAIPYLMFTRPRLQTGRPFGGWLMPIVPPMVSASTGALLVAHAPAGQARLSLLLCCYAMFGLSLVVSIAIITLIWYRLARHDLGEARMVPTLWIVLGPLGQSVTAANLLGGAAHLAMRAPYASALLAFGVVFGVPVLGFALLWATIAGAVTLRTAREHLPFSLTWWSFTFPIGTVVTGTTGLALHTDSVMLRLAAAVFYAVLVGAWLVVAARTARGSLRGRIFLPAPVPA
jgi:C4-dicarboxylate transporter/malic acid transport protein